MQMSKKLQRRSSRSGTQLSLASLSDVAFLLLVFFIATTIFPVDRGLAVLLPTAHSQLRKVPPSNVLVLQTTETGQVFADDVAVPVDGIEEIVRMRTRANPKLVVMLRTHVDAPYGTMVSVLDQVKLADAQRISFQREDH